MLFEILDYLLLHVVFHPFPLLYSCPSKWVPTLMLACFTCLLLIFYRSSIILTSFISGKSWAYLVLLYVYVQVSRIIVVGLSFPFLRYFGYGLDWKEAIILIWSGLRGAVALSLSLSVKVRCY